MFLLQTDYFHLFICVAIVVIYGDDVIEQQLATDQMLLHFGNLAMHMNGELILRKVNEKYNDLELVKILFCTFSLSLSFQCVMTSCIVIWERHHLRQIPHPAIVDSFSLCVLTSSILSFLQARSLLYQFRLLPRIPCSLHDLCKLCGSGMWDSGYIPAVECTGNHPDSESCPYGGTVDEPSPKPGNEGRKGLKTREVFAFRK